MKEKSKKNFSAISEGMILPSIELDKGIIRKTIIDKNGMTHEVEHEIKLPKIIRKKDDVKQ